MDPIPLPPPYKGQSDELPAISTSSPYAVSVLNFGLDSGEAVLRHGDSVWRTIATNQIPLSLVTYGVGAGQKMLVCWDNGTKTVFADASSGGGGALTVAYTLAGLHGGDDDVHTLYFKGYLLFFGEASMRPSVNGVPQFDGSSWSLSGYTYPTIGTPFGGTTYKSRAYILSRTDTKYAYSDLSAIAGAVHEVDLADVISNFGYLYGIRSVALSEGIQQQTVLCFVFSSGEVLAYTGSYPNSDDWTLVGRFIIPQPLYYHSFVDANGDSFVITVSGLVSLRTLFTQGVDVAVQKGLSHAIANRWAQIFVTGLAAVGTSYRLFIHGTYDPNSQRITIIFPNYIDKNGKPDVTALSSMRLVYSFKSDSWVEHKIKLANPGDSTVATVFNGAAYYGTLGGIARMEGAIDFMDAQPDGGAAQGIEYEIISAPVPQGSDSSRIYTAPTTGLIRPGMVHTVIGMDVILESDLYNETTYQFIGDLGVQTSVPQKTNAPTGVQKPFVDASIQATYTQYKLSGTTVAGKTVGLLLHGTNVWLDQGDTPR